MIAKREVKRETAATVRELGKVREVIVIIRPSTGEIGFRPKGLRRTEWLTTDVCWELAIKARLRFEQKEKKRRKP